MTAGELIAIGIACVALIVSCAALWIAYINGDTREWHDKGIGR
jgi:hypothetical protein